MPVFLLYAPHNDRTVTANLGQPEYSYYFVLEEVRRALAPLGPVLVVDDEVETDSTGATSSYPLTGQVEALNRLSRSLGEPCVLLAFAPPHRVPTGILAPTIPVFAWEYSDIPTETWDENPRNDWRTVLGEYGTAATHSRFSVEAVRRVMGEDFDIESIPAPVWDRFSALRPRAGRPDLGPRNIALAGKILDSAGDASGDGRSALSATTTFSLDLPAPPPAASAGFVTADSLREIPVHGVLYATVFNPNDGRKNWHDMVRAFGLALRDRDDATLVLRLIGKNDTIHAEVARELSRLAPLRCRVIVSNGFVSGEDYARLALATTYAVNSSVGEGQCLPLMEYLSVGMPAVAPSHSGMADYIDASTAFVVRTSPEPAVWPQDPRSLYRTWQQRIDFSSLMEAFRTSYEVASREPDRYAAMAAAARERLRRHCSEQVVRAKVASLVARRLARSAA